MTGLPARSTARPVTVIGWVYLSRINPFGVAAGEFSLAGVPVAAGAGFRPAWALSSVAVVAGEVLVRGCCPAADGSRWTKARLIRTTRPQASSTLATRWLRGWWFRLSSNSASMRCSSEFFRVIGTAVVKIAARRDRARSTSCWA